MKLFNTMSTAFDNFDQTVRSYLSKTFASLGMQYSHSQIFGVIFDGIKGVMQNMMFYIEDALTEQNIFTASRKRSVYSLAKVSGYEANYGSCASGVLLCKLHINNGLVDKTTKLYIKNKSRIVNQNTGMTYTVQLPSDYYSIDVSKPLVVHELKVIQGTYHDTSYIAKGYVLETIHITTTELFDKNYIEVLVDGEPWNQVANLYDMSENSKEYIFSIGYDNTFDIQFGNGIYGKRLEEGQSISVRYLAHAGTIGNILPETNTMFAFQDYATDIIGNTVNPNEYLNLEMSTCISGGTNADSINFVRNMIGMNSRSLVLASEDNFKLFFKRFSFIGYVNCWSESNSMIVNATCLQDISNKSNIKKYFELDNKDLILTTEQKQMVQNTLENSKKSFAGVTLKFKDPIIRKFAIICYVKIDNTYNKDSISENIKLLLAKYFMNLMEDGQFISKSDIIKYIIDNTDNNIKAIDIDFISDLAEQTYKNGYYIKYELKYVNGTYQYMTKKQIYEKQTTPGLDSYGNISLDSKLEIPLISGNFKYYTNKESYDKKNTITIPGVQINFI